MVWHDVACLLKPKLRQQIQYCSLIGNMAEDYIKCRLAVCGNENALVAQKVEVPHLAALLFSKFGDINTLENVLCHATFELSFALL